ncbi:unnamed protein product [Ambrosiozyma monospora]|uniref:Unnamed protein product n=1 Tax=Ambrosiozyma monospora TaxID=43982 RepID=A0ACB5U5L1_AMBMO|nr:unnamed protein product [Ambrosiozyma monospora]
MTYKDTKAINQLITYLTDTRRKLTRLLDPASPQFEWHGYLISIELYEELATTGSTDDDGKEEDNSSALRSLEMIDNYLFQCYLLTNMRMVGPLLRISNYCTFEIVERKCLNLKLYNELIDFYYFRKSHEKALALLNKLCFETVNEDGRSNTVTGSPTSSLSFLFNVDFMLKYIQKLGNDNLNLVLEYSQKLIQTDPGYFHMIFMNDSIECESLDNFAVVDFLAENNWIQFQLEYLEYVIYDTGFENVRLINKLIELYINIDYIANYDKILRAYGLNKYNASHFLKKINNLLRSDDVDEFYVSL